MVFKAVLALSLKEKDYGGKNRSQQLQLDTELSLFHQEGCSTDLTATCSHLCPSLESSEA